MRYIILIFFVTLSLHSFANKLNITAYGASELIGFDNATAIKAAFVAAAASDTVVFNSGAHYYTTRVTVNEGISVRATTTGAGRCQLEFLGTPLVGWHILQMENCPSLVLDNLELIGTFLIGDADSGMTPLKVWKCKNAVVKNMLIRDNGYIGISIYKDTNITLLNNLVNNTDVGMLMQGYCYNATLQGNHFDGGTSEAISIYGEVTSGTVTGVDRKIIIIQNDAHNKPLSSAYHIRLGDSISVIGNWAYDCRNGAGTQSYTPTHVTIKNNFFKRCMWGVFGNYTSSLIDSNVIENTTKSGIWLGVSNACSGTSITNNIITEVNGDNTQEDCIRTSNADGTIITNNRGFDYRIATLNKVGIRISTASTNTTVSNNFMKGQTAYIYSESGATGTIQSGNVTLTSDMIRFGQSRVKIIIPSL